MIIKKITLDNIKSYVHEEIHFTNGINFILGANGSGKTTIIESIGLALFDFKKKSMDDMLRYNKTKGYIEVEFKANDGRDYRVIRTIRPASTTVKIIDVDTDTELYSGVGEVYAFIKNVLKIARTKDFAKMFEEIIAVPQGQYVSAFLERPSTRKENFDRLFDLHIYKNLNNKLTNIASNIKDNKISVLKGDIDIIIGKVAKYEEKKIELENIVLQIKQLEENQNLIDKEIDKALNTKQKLETTKVNLEALKMNRILTEEKIKNINQLIEANQEELKHSKLAQEIVEKNKVHYIKYQENVQRISKFEKQYESLLAIRNTIKTKENEILVIENNIKNYEENKQSKSQDYETRRQEIIKLNTDSIFLKTEIDKAKKEYEKKDKENLTHISILDKEKKELNDLLERLNYYQILYDNIVITDWTPYENIEEKLEFANQKIKQIAERAKELEKYKAQRTKLAVEIQNAKDNSQISSDGKCPFFKEKCLNIGEQSLTKYFANIILEKNQEIEKIDDIIHKYSEEVNDERKYLIEIQNLENNNKYIEDYKNKMEKLQDEFYIDFEDFVDKSNDNLFSQITNLKEKFKQRLNVIENTEREYSQIRDSLVKEDAQISHDKLQLINMENSINNLEMVNKKLHSEIESLDLSLMMANKNRNYIKSEINKINEELIAVEDSKELLDNIKSENKQLEQFKDEYLSNVTKAKEVNQKLEAISSDQKLIVELKAKKDNYDEDIVKLQDEYSDSLYQETNAQYTLFIEKKSSIATSISEKGDQRNKLQNEVFEMDNLFKERDIKQEELERYTSINEFINRAKKIFTELPKELSTTYREYIGHIATKLYRRISKEHVSLELTEDYEVIITEDDNPRNKKSIDVLSGGEQMSVAIAIRLSMLKHLAGLDIYFLDEPTVNLDTQRRESVADVVADISEDLSQLFVISHDDTFDQITDTVIKVEKTNSESKIG